MPGENLFLVAEDGPLAGAIRGHLRRSLGWEPALCRTRSLPGRVLPDTSGVVVFAASCAGDREAVRGAVQDLCVRQAPLTLFLVENHEGTGLNGLAPYLAGRLRWPAEAAALVSLVKDHLRPGANHALGGDETPQEVMRRQLLAGTPSLAGLLGPLALAAGYDVPVLLCGETGTGKTFLARLLHQYSARRQNRFLVVPCGAVAPNLIGSEFFGHARGAFTGADRSTEGKFAAAGAGTVLLDEIDTLGLEQQANLLRLLETGEYEPVGSNETRRCQARVIAASNADLEAAVEAGRFRADLYYRLNVMAFHLPPLRDRVADVGPLVRAAAARFNSRFGKGLFEVSAEVLRKLESFRWPGNIRQLENVVQQAVLASDGPKLLPAHLPPELSRQPTIDPRAEGAGGDLLQHTREDVERSLIQKALDRVGGNRTRAALTLGISRVTLYKKMRKYGLLEDGERAEPDGLEGDEP